MSLIDVIFPKKCLGCGRGTSYLCSECMLSQPVFLQRCIECGKEAIDGITHSKCKNAWTLDGVYSVWQYTQTIRAAIIKTKFAFAREVAKESVFYLLEHFEKEGVYGFEKALIVPIPLHAKRERWRGFNQSAVVAERLANVLGWEYLEDLIVRRIHKKAQSEIKHKRQRVENIKNVFCLNQKHDKSALENHNIIIFDDVLTTGSTMREAGKLLKRNGYKNVWGLTIAR